MAARRSLGLEDDLLATVLGRNLNATFVAVGPRQEYVVKILSSKPTATLNTEFASLEELHDIGTISGLFATPQPKSLLLDVSAYVAGRVAGQRATDVIVAGDLPGAEKVGFAAGAALACIHERWDEHSVDSAHAELLDDLQRNAPWRWSRRARRILGAVAARLQGSTFASVRQYGDFDPVNVLVATTGIALLDPPEDLRFGVPHWDVGTFVLGLHRAHWRRPWFASRSRPAARVAEQAFLEGYREARSWGPSDDLLMVACQLMRLAQLRIFWGTSQPLKAVESRIRSLIANGYVPRERDRLLAQLERQT